MFISILSSVLFRIVRERSLRVNAFACFHCVFIMCSYKQLKILFLFRNFESVIKIDYSLC